MNFKPMLLSAIACASLSVPKTAIAQLSPTCSELKNIYVLARKTYDFTVSGNCVYVDGKHSPFLTKDAYNALSTKPEVNVFY